MKVSCLQENLNRGLALVGRAVATRTTLPITQNVLIATDQGRLKLSATNLEIAITTWVGAQVDEEGATTVPARLLNEFIGSLPPERVDMDTTANPNALNLKCARFEARLNGSDAEEFPPIPAVEEGPAAHIESKVLKTALNQVVFAAATEESRPVLTGVKVDIKENEFTMAAADGFRLAFYRGALAKPITDPIDVIIPARTLHELNRLMGDQDEEVVEMTMTPAKGQVLFKLGNVEMMSQLIQGTFPNYSQLIPQSYQTRTVINLAEFLRATRSSAIFARDGSGIIRLQMINGPDDATGKVVISARAEEIGDNQGEIDGQIEGEESKIAFNSKYLLDVLSVLERGQIALETTSPSSPGVFRPIESDNYIHVVMPMFVQW